MQTMSPGLRQKLDVLYVRYLSLIDFLNAWVLTPWSTSFQLCGGGQCTYPCFEGTSFTNFPQNIPSNPHNKLRKNGYRRERDKPCLVAFLRNEIDRIWNRTSGPLLSSPVRYLLSYSFLGLGTFSRKKKYITEFYIQSTSFPRKTVARYGQLLPPIFICIV